MVNRPQIVRCELGRKQEEAGVPEGDFIQVASRAQKRKQRIKRTACHVNR